MESLILIPAAGRQRRWKSTLPKQLVTVNGETLLDRHLRMFQPYTGDFLILADDSLICDTFDTYLPRDHRYLCETLVNTRHLWSQRTIILLGDTILSPEITRVIATDRRPCAFWGNWSDILAISVYEEEANALTLAMWSAVRHAQLEEGKGKLWQAYRAYCGFELDTHTHDNWGVFVDTMDWSRDFDTVEEYTNWIEGKARTLDLWD